MKTPIIIKYVETRLEEWPVGRNGARSPTPEDGTEPGARYQQHIDRIRARQADAQRNFFEIQAARIGSQRQFSTNDKEAWLRLKHAVTEAQSQIE